MDEKTQKMNAQNYNQILIEEEENRFQKINEFVERVVSNPTGYKSIQLTATWIFLALSGLVLSAISINILSDYVSLVYDVARTGMVEITILILSFAFALLYFTIRIDNTWPIQLVTTISKYVTDFLRHKNDSKMISVTDDAVNIENLLFFAAFAKKHIEETSPELYDEIMDEVNKTMRARKLKEEEFDIKKIGTEAAKSHLETSKEIEKINDYLGLNKFPDNSEGEDDK